MNPTDALGKWVASLDDGTIFSVRQIVTFTELSDRPDEIELRGRDLLGRTVHCRSVRICLLNDVAQTILTASFRSP